MKEVVQGGNFDDLVQKAQQQTISFTPSAILGHADTSFGWEHCVTDIYKKFLSAFLVQLNDAFEQLKFWRALDILDTCKIPKKKDLIQYSNNKLQDLGEQ